MIKVLFNNKQVMKIEAIPEGIKVSLDGEFQILDRFQTEEEVFDYVSEMASINNYQISRMADGYSYLDVVRGTFQNTTYIGRIIGFSSGSPVINTNDGYVHICDNPRQEKLQVIK